MNAKSNFEWEEYYEKFADQLLLYKNKRKTLIGKIKKAYEKANIKMPRLAEKESMLVDIDPFTVMGLFNRQMRNETRDKLFFSISKELGLSFQETHFDYEGIPVLNPMSANYYWFNPEKQKNVINSEWKFLELLLSKDCLKTDKEIDRFINLFNEIVNLKGNKFPKVTMAMFYVRPKKFLALDGRNFWYIFEWNKSIFRKVDGLPNWKNGSHFNINEYIGMLDFLNSYFRKSDSKVNSICALSFLAYEESEKENERIAKEKNKKNGNQLIIDIPTSGKSEKYDKDNFLKEIFMEEESYDELCDLLINKKNIILQGPPGVGKTFIAKRLAWSLLGEKRKDNIEMIQFHQSYSYEDFIEGYRPNKDGGFDIKSGVFYDFCMKADGEPNNRFFFVIDEINRGNMSKIFGELFMLIENDKRGESLKLLYSGEDFSIPKNVYIIGTMNTADRSLALLDYALRRRFAFFDIKPAFNSKGFKDYTKNAKDPHFKEVIKVISELNNSIAEDSSLNEGFCIGHSYFCGDNINDSNACENIVKYEIIQLLKEYWYDEPETVDNWVNKLLEASK